MKLKFLITKLASNDNTTYINTLILMERTYIHITYTQIFLD